jgi:hypothetical protein
VTSSHSTFSTGAATAGVHTLTSQDSFEEQLREEDEEEGSDRDQEGGDGQEEEGGGTSAGFSRLPGGKTSLYLEGQMDKKSPAHNMWQERWFKLMTRVTNGGTVLLLSPLSTSGHRSCLLLRLHCQCCCREGPTCEPLPLSQLPSATLS